MSGTLWPRRTRRSSRVTLPSLLTSAALVATSLVSPAVSHSQAQSTGALVSRAMDLESAGRNQDAIAAWRAALAAGAVVPGAMGLERVFAVLHQEDSVLVALDTLIPKFPNEVVLRSAQLRTLITLGRDADARAAFERWRDAGPQDVAPYRDYARVLLFNNRTAAADTVLRDAVTALGSSRVLLLELAQLRAALGRWREAAEAWRETMRDQPYFESATVFSLTSAPDAARDSIRAVLTEPGAPLGATQALGFLELEWGSPREGWRVLARIPASDTAVAIWTEFAGEAERVQAWATMRDALSAIYAVRPAPSRAIRAAVASLRANDAESALTMARAARAGSEPALVAREILPLELEALARLGRGAEAERVLAAAALGPSESRAFARTIAWAWVRAGDIARARAILADAPLDAEDAVAGWLALFEGDLAAARPGLRYSESVGADAVTALALLSRTTATESKAVGDGFLALARADSARAVREFSRAAEQVPDAASFLLAMAARLEVGRGERVSGMRLWERVATAFAESPEAPEARLEWGRALRAGGDPRGAREQLETLILSYPSSALVPQARRELDALPPTAATR